MSNKNQYLHNFYCTVFVNKQKGMSTLNFIAFTPYKILSSTNTFKKKRGSGVKCKTATKKHTCVCFGRSKQTRASKARPCDTQRIATSNRVLTVPPQFQKKRVGGVKQKRQQKSTLACALVEASRLARARHVLATPSVLRQAIASSPYPHSFKKRESVV